MRFAVLREQAAFRRGDLTPDRTKAPAAKRFEHEQQAVVEHRVYGVALTPRRRVALLRFVKRLRAVATLLERYTAAEWYLGQFGLMHFGRRLGGRGEPWEVTLRKDPCVYCGGTSDTIDHVVATHRGGSNRCENLVGACKVCNNAKGSGSMLLFLHERHYVATRRAEKAAKRARRWGATIRARMEATA